MRADDPVHLDEVLGVPGGLEPAHASLPLTRWLMRILGTVIQIPVLPVSHTGHQDPFGSGVAAQFVGDDHPRTTTTVGPQQLAKEAHRRESVTPGLDKNINDNTVLINGSPEIMPRATDVEEYLIQMPLVAGPGTPSPQASGVILAELVTPAPDRFVADQYTSRSHRLFDVTKAHAETEVEPNTIRDDLSREPIATIRVAGHPFSIPFAQTPST